MLIFPQLALLTWIGIFVGFQFFRNKLTPV